MMHNLFDSTAVAPTILPIVGNNTTEGTGTAVDLRGYESALLIVELGLSGDTLSGGVNIQPAMQESDDGSAWNTVAAIDMEGSFPLVDSAPEDELVYVAGYKGSKRFIRALLTFTGTHTNGTPMSAVVVRGRPRHVGTTV